jgi:hypothetical protein
MRASRRVASRRGVAPSILRPIHSTIRRASRRVVAALRDAALRDASPAIAASTIDRARSARASEAAPRAEATPRARAGR